MKLVEIILAALVCVGLSLTVASAGQQALLPKALQHKVSADLQSKIFLPSEKQKYRVIVELFDAENSQLDGRVNSAKQKQLRKQALSRTRHSVLRGLSKNKTEFEINRSYEVTPTLALTTDVEGVIALANSPFVRKVSHDIALFPMLEESVPLIGADKVFEQGFDGHGKVVVIMDTGVESYHPFLQNRVVGEACYSSMFEDPYLAETLCPNGKNEMSGIGAALSDICTNYASCNHGTHVAGIAAGSGEMRHGVANAANIIAIQVFSYVQDKVTCRVADSCLVSFVSDEIAALEAILELSETHDIASVNISVGGGKYTKTCDDEYPGYTRLVGILKNKGIAVVVAAGNDGASYTTNFPGCLTETITVGSSNKTDSISWFSNLAEWVDLVAPGSRILSSVTGESFSKMSGTSMAAPHVAGAWALMKSINPDASVDEILKVLQDTGIEIEDLHSDVVSKRIQLDTALDALLGKQVESVKVESQ